MAHGKGPRFFLASVDLLHPGGIQLDVICGNAALASLSHWLATTVLLQQLKVGKEKCGSLACKHFKLNFEHETSDFPFFLLRRFGSCNQTAALQQQF